MDRLPVTWETFVARRRLNVEDWLAANGITHYQALVDRLKKKGIAPPALTTVEKYFKKPRKPKPAPEPVVLTPEPVVLTPEPVDDTGTASEPPKKRRVRRKAQHNTETE